MLSNGTLFLVVCGLCCSGIHASPAVRVTVDPSNITHNVAEAANGCHFSPLDHQLFTVYSQMVYDESFEQLLGSLQKEGPGDTVSLGWSNITASNSSIEWLNDPASAYNGAVPASNAE